MQLQDCSAAFAYTNNPIITTTDRVLGPQVTAMALAQARKGVCTRTFKFGRSNGHWVINGEDWITFRVAADDIGQNTWEVRGSRLSSGRSHKYIFIGQ